MTASRCRILAIAFLAFQSAYAQDSLAVPGIRLFPRDHRIAEFAADGSAHRFSVSKQLESGVTAMSVGGVLPWVEVMISGIPLQVSTGASIRSTLDPGRSIAVISSEFFVDYVLIDLVASPIVFIRAGVGHTSHHLGDSFVSDPGILPIDYSKDYVRMHILYEVFASRARLYAGIWYAYNFVAGSSRQDPLTVHLGMDGDLFTVTTPLSIYGGWDMKLLEEHGFGSTHRYEAGLKWDKGGGRSIRVGFAFVDGLDERGQFFGARRRGASIGLRADL